MATFAEIESAQKNEHHKRIYSILAQRESSSLTADGLSEITLDANEVEEIRDEQAQIVKDSRPDTQSLAELRDKLTIYGNRRISQYTTDGYSNSVNSIGTSIDPASAVDCSIPVSITPSEASAYYASGGIPTRIIDKKAGCLALDGVQFECASMNPDDLQQLSDYAASCGFSRAYLDTLTQSLIFGGSVCYPVLDGDTPLTYGYNSRQIKEMCAGKKDFIQHWVTADRWNCVFVPDYTITAQDYLFAKSFFLPIGGVRVSTKRMAVVRPKRLPFWAAIQQMGWSTSEFEGWIKDYEAYKIMVMSLPIMAQQSSLMYHALPADGILIENGPDYAREYMKENEKQMREWSMLHPRAINSIGEIKTIDRTYSGYRDLVSESKIALCASSGFAESIIFGEKATGLASDNRDDVLLKQSEMIRLLFNTTSPAFAPCTELLVYSCFGLDSEQAKHAKEVKLKADNGVVLSDTEKAQIGGSFAQILATLSQLGLPLDSSLKIAKSFAPSAEIDENLLTNLGGESEGMDSELWNLINAGRS